MLIAHVADFHVSSGVPVPPRSRDDAERVVRRVVADLASFSPGLDAVVLTGDLTESGSPEDYELFKDILAPLSMPALMVPGNHDRREEMRSALVNRLPFGNRARLNYEIAVGGLRFIALDTLIEGRPEGALDAETIAWLEDKLSVATDTPTFVLLHHPPFPCGMGTLDQSSLIDGRDEIARIVRSYRGQLFLFAGHIHRPYWAIWNGAQCAVAGSPINQLALDLARTPQDPPLVREPYAYRIYHIDGDKITIHSRFVSLDG